MDYIKPYPTVGKIIESYRKKIFFGHGGKGKCAASLGVSRQTYGGWESGAAIPGNDKIPLLAGVFKIKPSILLKEIADAAIVDEQSSPQLISGEVTIIDMVQGPITVVPGGTLNMHGMLLGDLHVLDKGSATIAGMVTGNTFVNASASVVILGKVNGSVYNNGGTVTVRGIVNSVITNSGTSNIEGGIVTEK